MPRVAVDDNKRMNLRLRPEQKATLMRAAALRHTDLTDFVLQPALREAQAVIEESERIVLSERDSLLVLNLLENPPAPNTRLRAAIAAMPKVCPTTRLRLNREAAVVPCWGATSRAA